MDQSAVGAARPREAKVAKEAKAAREKEKAREVKEAREKLFRSTERNGPSILTSSPRTKPTELLIKFPSTPATSQSPRSRRPRTEWPESLRWLLVSVLVKERPTRRSRLPTDDSPYLNSHIHSSHINTFNAASPYIGLFTTFLV